MTSPDTSPAPGTERSEEREGGDDALIARPEDSRLDEKVIFNNPAGKNEGNTSAETKEQGSISDGQNDN